MSNPNDEVRDAILRHLYGVHQKARSPKTAGLLISELTKALKPLGHKQQAVASNLDYLVQKMWVREVIEQRSFTTGRGTTQNSERRTYKISDTGIDHLEAASVYQRTDIGGHINITNIHGVTVVGEGNVVNTTFADLSRVLTELQQAVLQCPRIDDESKLSASADIDSLRAQLQKATPDTGIIKMLWGNVEKIAAVGGVIDLFHKAATYIQPLLK